ncbi:MAG TPA: helix-turn-helix domain-containing protein [Amycolatopsis sp.]|nr:helix-turn-helix domain-containing protein [Amycolatopsis sp.]
MLAAAERLFAEHGVAAVSNRQVSEAAGQGNHTAVGYHFGTKTGLIRAIVRLHGERIERLRDEMTAGDPADARGWVRCLVQPLTAHLAELGTPTWFGRFTAQIVTDPAYHEIVMAESLTSPSLVRALDGLDGCAAGLPAEVRLERRDMARLLTVHMVAGRERALAEGTPTPSGSWRDFTGSLVDAIVGLWCAPVTRPPVTCGRSARFRQDR